MTGTIFDKRLNAAYSNKEDFENSLDNKKINLADFSTGIFFAFDKEDKENPSLAIWGNPKQILKAQEFLNKAILEKLAEIYDACVQYPEKGTKQ